MMPAESQTFDKKSLRLVTGRTADWDELAKDAVAFASHLNLVSMLPRKLAACVRTTPRENG